MIIVPKEECTNITNNSGGKWIDLLYTNILYGFIGFD